jgi:hypothetical protein
LLIEKTKWIVFYRMIWIAAFLLTVCHPGVYFPQLSKNRDEKQEGFQARMSEKRDQTPSPA